MKLTKLQKDVLKDYDSVFGEGWAYPSELGVTLKPVKVLVSLGLLERDGDFDGSNFDYRITSEGKKYLNDLEYEQYSP